MTVHLPASWIAKRSFYEHNKPMQVYLVAEGLLVDWNGERRLVTGQDWDAWFRQDDLFAITARLYESAEPASAVSKALCPIGSQEVWACGVTYFRSRTARMEESKDAGGGTFYDRVYEAVRPELFMKCTAHRARGPGQPVIIRKDATWNVPEPELTLAVSANGQLNGYTIGNDMSSRDIEGENPLYLPQAKTYDGCAALGPCLLLQEEEPAPSTQIILQIERAGSTAFEDATDLSQLKRGLTELVGFLTFASSFPTGAYLMTGTGIIPEDDFTLQPGDIVHITIDGIGTLSNPVALST